MKNKIFLIIGVLSLSLSISVPIKSKANSFNKLASVHKLQGIEDGWYSATVRYTNFKKSSTEQEYPTTPRGQGGVSVGEYSFRWSTGGIPLYPSAHSTETHATYTLNVEVEDGIVVKISFGEGKYIHNGYNEQGYIYNGGRLAFYTDYKGNISAATTVTTTDDNGVRTFEITIE